MLKGHLPNDVRHGQPNPAGLALEGRKRHQNDSLHISDEMSGDGELCVLGWIYCVDKTSKEKRFRLIYSLLRVTKLFYLCNIYYYILVHVKEN